MKDKFLKETNFQIERITALVDGIFGFAATLLIQDLLQENFVELPANKLIGILTSFCIIGYYWTVHHRIFQYIENYTSTLIWINLGYSFSIILFPFTSVNLGNKFTDSNNTVIENAYGIYVINVCITALFNALLWYYLTKSNQVLLKYKISRERVFVGFYFTLVVPTIFILSFIIFKFNHLAGYLTLLSIPFILKYGMNNLLKKADQNENTDN